MKTNIVIFFIFKFWNLVFAVTDIRLVGNTATSGRVEIFHGGHWGTICDDTFHEKEAVVACRMLGFNTLKAVSYGLHHFGAGSGQIWLHDVNCTGEEKSLNDCYIGTWGKGHCSHAEDVSVDCNYNPIRLVGGTNEWEGRLEVFRGTWGTVCDDGFDNVDAEVVCKIMGYSNSTSGTVAQRNAHFGEGSGTIWLDDLNCKGNETDIKQCVRGNWAQTNCDHSEDVGVSCFVSVRLVGGAAPHEGRLEVFHDGHWGTVCSNEFDALDARVFCRMLGYETDFPKIYKGDIFGKGQGPIMIDRLNCSMEDKRLDTCQFPGWKVTTCNHDDDVGISCVPRRVQLSNGRGPWEGRVEVFYDNKWESVCDDSFGQNDAVKICSILGFDTTDVQPIAVEGSVFGSSKKHLWLNGIDCITSDGSIAGCEAAQWVTHTCDPGHEAGVVCQLETKPVRLVGGAHSMEGRLEVNYLGVWHTVCDKYITGDDATAICNMLTPYPFSRNVIGVVKRNSFYGQGSGPVALLAVPWSDSSSSHVTRFLPWEIHGLCDHTHDAGVSCTDATSVKLHSSAIVTPPSGTLEILFNKTRISFCDSHFDYKDGQPVCRRLGYWSSSPTTYTHTIFGESLDTDSQRLHPLCEGNEPDITFCRTVNNWHGVHCSNTDTVGVQCTPTNLGKDNLRIVHDGQVGRGRLEVLYNGHWGTFCWKNWNLRNTKVVCKHLDYNTNNPTSFSTQRELATVTIGTLLCTGSETDIGLCTADFNKTHCTDNVVGVDCTDGIKVRLVDGSNPMSGRVEVNVNGVWGSVDYVDYDTSVYNAKVICQMLGYSNTDPSIDRTASEQVYHSLAVEGLRCGGWEEHIRQCQYNNGGRQEYNVIMTSCFRCISTYTDRSGFLTSPHFPSFYDKNTDCLYVIKPPEGPYYKLVFDEVALADVGDWIEVRDGALGHQLGLISNNQNLPIYSGKEFWIRFKTNEQLNFKGFRLHWDVMTIADTVTVDCTSNEWNVSVNMTLLWKFFPNTDVSNIRLTNPDCTGRVNSDALMFQNQLKSCQSSVLVAGHGLYHSGRIYDTTNSLSIPVNCTYP